jgi:hypothetical protein
MTWFQHRHGHPRLAAQLKEDVDARDKPAHDDGETSHRTLPVIARSEATKKSSSRLLQGLRWIASLRSQ